VFFGEHKASVFEGKVVLPKKFYPGMVECSAEECLLVIPSSLKKEEKEIFLSESQLSFIGAENKVLFVGCGSYFEIWNPEKFKEMKSEEADFFERNFEKLIEG